MLILGTLPGAESLRRGQYYAHPRNAFWRLIGGVIERDLINLPYDDRLEALGRARIGLWDVIATASRRGSLDAAIRDTVRTDLVGLVERLPDLRAIAFNGGTASAVGRRQLSGIRAELVDLPSSSPAYAGMTVADKLARWCRLAEYLA